MRGSRDAKYRATGAGVGGGIRARMTFKAVSLQRPRVVRGRASQAERRCSSPATPRPPHILGKQQTRTHAALSVHLDQTADVAGTQRDRGRLA